MSTLSFPLAYLSEEQIYWIAAPCVVIGCPLIVLLGYMFRDFIKAAAAVIFLGFLVFVAVLLVKDWIAGPVDAKFIAATRELNRMLTTTGNTDSEVLAACSAVQDEYKAIDVSKVPSEKAAAMKSVAEAAKLWQLQLALLKVDALSTALGHDKSREAGMDMDVAHMTLPGIRRSIQDYLKKYD